MRFIFFFIIFPLFVLSQTEDAWVYFKDKPSSTTFLSNPISMLTQRSLDRRIAQNIALNISDVPVEQTYINQITASSGITVMAKSRWMNCLHIRGTQTNINNLLSLSFVDKIVWARKNLNPVNRITKVDKWQDFNAIQSNYSYGGSSNQIQMLNGHLLHQQNYEGQGKIIAVLDSGFTGVNSVAPFQNLFDVNNTQLLGGYNFCDRNTNFYARDSHGTSVLSCMGGFVDGSLVGTAPKAKYYLFITEDVNSENPVEESYWVEGAELADYYGVDVINSSLGYSDYDDPGYSHTVADMVGNKTFAAKGANMAFSKGIVVVVSAGNSGNSTTNPYISTPSDAFGALCVGSVNSSEIKSSFSSIGPNVPNFVKPDVMARGSSSTVSNTSGNIVTASGTSFSSPIMAGMVATFWSAKPSLTAQEVVNYVKQSADRYNNPNQEYGYGIPDFQLALNNALNNPSYLINEISVSPNPTKDFIKVTINNLNNNIFVLYNTIGQKVLEKSFSQTENIIEINQLPNGIYYYDLSANGSKKGKLIKN